MSEHARKEHRDIVPGPIPIDEHERIGEEALHLTRWFAKSKYHLMAGFVGELQRPPAARDPQELRDRFCRAITHAHRVHRARGVVTFLLALGIVSAATTSVLNALDVDEGARLLARAAALSATASVVLVAVRLALDRYLERADVAATFIAMQMATAGR